MNINFNKLFQYLTPFFIIFTIAYAASSVIFFVMPKSGVNYINKNELNLDYRRYDLSSLFKKDQKQNFTLSSTKKEYVLLSSLILNAIYAKNDGHGWVIVKEKSSGKTHILESGESFRDYTLKFIYPSYVIFEKNQKEYKLQIIKNDKKFDIVTQKNSDESWNEKISYNGDNIIVKRKLVNSYVNDIEKIWNDVQIDEVKQNNINQGFKISNIAKGSVIEKLGLKKGDILKKINNVELNNYNAVFKIYKEIKNLKTLNMEVLRKNRKVELNYEID